MFRAVDTMRSLDDTQNGVIDTKKDELARIKSGNNKVLLDIPPTQSAFLPEKAKHTCCETETL